MGETASKPMSKAEQARNSIVSSVRFFRSLTERTAVNALWKAQKQIFKTVHYENLAIFVRNLNAGLDNPDDKFRTFIGKKVFVNGKPNAASTLAAYLDHLYQFSKTTPEGMDPAKQAHEINSFIEHMRWGLLGYNRATHELKLYSHEENPIEEELWKDRDNSYFKHLNILRGRKPKVASDQNDQEVALIDANQPQIGISAIDAMYEAAQQGYDVIGINPANPRQPGGAGFYAQGTLEESYMRHSDLPLHLLFDIASSPEHHMNIEAQRARLWFLRWYFTNLGLVEQRTSSKRINTFDLYAKYQQEFEDKVKELCDRKGFYNLFSSGGHAHWNVSLLPENYNKNTQPLTVHMATVFSVDHRPMRKGAVRDPVRSAIKDNEEALIDEQRGRLALVQTMVDRLEQEMNVSTDSIRLVATKVGNQAFANGNKKVKGSAGNAMARVLVPLAERGIKQMLCDFEGDNDPFNKGFQNEASQVEQNEDGVFSRLDDLMKRIKESEAINLPLNLTLSCDLLNQLRINALPIGVEVNIVNYRINSNGARCPNRKDYLMIVIKSLEALEAMKSYLHGRKTALSIHIPEVDLQEKDSEISVVMENVDQFNDPDKPDLKQMIEKILNRIQNLKFIANNDMLAVQHVRNIRAFLANETSFPMPEEFLEHTKQAMRLQILQCFLDQLPEEYQDNPLTAQDSINAFNNTHAFYRGLLADYPHVHGQLSYKKLEAIINNNGLIGRVISQEQQIDFLSNANGLNDNLIFQSLSIPKNKKWTDYTEERKFFIFRNANFYGKVNNKILSLQMELTEWSRLGNIPGNEHYKKASNEVYHAYLNLLAVYQQNYSGIGNAKVPMRKGLFGTVKQVSPMIKFKKEKLPAIVAEFETTYTQALRQIRNEDSKSAAKWGAGIAFAAALVIAAAIFIPMAITGTTAFGLMPLDFVASLTAGPVKLAATTLVASLGVGAIVGTATGVGNYFFKERTSTLRNKANDVGKEFNNLFENMKFS